MDSNSDRVGRGPGKYESSSLSVDEHGDNLEGMQKLLVKHQLSPRKVVGVRKKLNITLPLFCIKEAEKKLFQDSVFISSNKTILGILEISIS